MENFEKFTNNSENEDIQNVIKVFGKSLGYLLQNTEGVVVEVDSSMTFGEDVSKVLVFKYEDKIHIQKFDTELEPGSLINIITTEEEQ